MFANSKINFAEKQALYGDENTISFTKFSDTDNKTARVYDVTGVEIGNKAKYINEETDSDEEFAEPEPVVLTVEPKVKSTSQFMFKSDCPSELLVNIAKYIYYNCRIPHESFSIAAALNILSHVSRNKFYVEDSNTGLNLYMILVGPSGSGKDGPRKSINNLLKAIDYMESIDENMTSGSAVLHTLNNRVDHNSNMVLDEFGFILQDGKSGRTREFLKDTMTLYTYARSTWTGKRYANKNNHIPAINKPYINIFATTTPVELINGVKGGNAIDNGLLNRFLLIEQTTKGATNRNQVHDVPPDLITTLDELKSVDQDTPMTYEPGAKELLINLADNISTHPDYEPLSARYEEIVIKVAALLSLPKTTISRESVTWAAEYVKTSTDSMCAFFEQKLPKSNFHDQIKAAFENIRDAKKFTEKKYLRFTSKGLMPRTKLMSQLNLRKKEMSQIIDFLIEDKQIIQSIEEKTIVLKAL